MQEFRTNHVRKSLLKLLKNDSEMLANTGFLLEHLSEVTGVVYALRNTGKDLPICIVWDKICIGKMTSSSVQWNVG